MPSPKPSDPSICEGCRRPDWLSLRLVGLCLRDVKVGKEQELWLGCSLKARMPWLLCNDARGRRENSRTSRMRVEQQRACRAQAEAGAHGGCPEPTGWGEWEGQVCNHGAAQARAGNKSWLREEACALPEDVCVRMQPVFKGGCAPTLCPGGRS